MNINLPPNEWVNILRVIGHPGTSITTDNGEFWETMKYLNQQIEHGECELKETKDKLSRANAYIKALEDLRSLLNEKNLEAAER